MTRLSLVVVAVSASLAGACATKQAYLAGTRIPSTSINQSAVNAIESYRLAVERGDAESLMLMAHKQYWEDSGTPSGSDDYGYEGLRNVIQNRFKLATEVRYTMRYMSVAHQCKDELSEGCRATVDVLIDASFTINNVHGKPTRPDKRDQNQFLLQWDGRRWLFLSGM